MSANTDWTIGVLEWWVENADAARETEIKNGRGVQTGHADAESSDVIALRAREDQTRRVLKAVLDSKELPMVLRPWPTMSEIVDISEGIKKCHYALGRLRTDAETRAGLRPAAPTMAADALHPTVWGVIAGLWEQGHYRVCVQKAVTRLKGDVQDRINRHDLSDKKLMQQAFSSNPPQPREPRLRWPGNDTDLSVISMREGILTFSQGVFSAIRNITSHSADEIPKQEDFEMLASISLLARWVDECEVLTT